jgi:Protein of unknown function (DUF429)
VREETGVDPLSVSSNLLAICAMRCAHLLVELAGEGALDRTGAGLVAEVYPAAALRQWGLDPRGYKGTKPEKVAKRQELVATNRARRGLLHRRRQRRAACTATAARLRLRHPRARVLLLTRDLANGKEGGTPLAR